MGEILKLLGAIIFIIILLWWDKRDVKKEVDRLKYFEDIKNNNVVNGLNNNIAYPYPQIFPSNILCLADRKEQYKPLFTEYLEANRLPKFIRHNAFLGNEECKYCHITNFTVIDFETATAFPDSVCQIGIAIVENNKIVKTLSYYIKPPTIEFTNTKIHGIDYSKVKNAPNFGELWPTIKEYIQGKIIAAYNMPFDIGCLDAVLRAHKIYDVHYAAFDILETSRNFWPNLKNHKLVTVSDFLGIPLKAHDASSDVIAAAKVQNLVNTQDCTYKMKVLYKVYSYDQMNELFLKTLDVRTCVKACVHKIKSIKSSAFADYNDLLRYLEDNLINDDFTDNEVAKIYRLCGEIYEKCGNVDEAKLYYQKALTFNDKVGVKTKLKKLEK